MGRPPCLAAGIDDPAKRQALLATLVHLHRNLVVGPANAAAAHLDVWLDVVDRRLEQLQRRERL